MKFNQDKSSLPFLLVILAITIAGFIWVILSIYTTNFQVIPEEDALVVELTELQAQILYLDEVLTMSANMFVQTGDPVWEKRYEDNVTVIYEKLHRVIELVPGLSDIEAASQTETANNALVIIEQQAFFLVNNGQMKEAQDLMISNEYIQQKKFYADGARQFDEGIARTVAISQQNRQRSIGFLMLAVTSIAIIIALGWLWVLNAVKRWRENLEEASEKYRQAELSSEKHRAALAQEKSRAALAAEKHKARVAAQKSEKSLAAYAEKLSETNKDLEQFAYAASHDLKAPLKGIDTLAGWIQKDLGKSLKDKPAENMKRLRFRVKRLESLLDDMLTYSMVGREDSKLIQVNLNKEIEGLVDLLNIPKNFKVITANKLPTVLAPKGTLEQIFSNLINNAVKHHDRGEGTITITSSIIKVEQNEMWEFSVTDDGPGIKLKYQEKIFKLFQTLESRDDVEGSGMGLTIVKRLVNRQGGNIEVYSEGEGKGTTFRFTWIKT